MRKQPEILDHFRKPMQYIKEFSQKEDRSFRPQVGWRAWYKGVEGSLAVQEGRKEKEVRGSRFLKITLLFNKNFFLYNYLIETLK